MRVVHVLAEFSRNEAMGHWVAEIAGRANSVESIVITNKRAGAGGDVRVLEVGGSSQLFQFTRYRAIRKLLARLRPDLVHLHGGIFVSLLALSPAFRNHRLILSIHAWPSLPPLGDIWESGLRGLRSKAVFSLRVAASGMLPARVVRRALRRSQIRGIITQDQHVQERLSPLTRTPVRWVFTGADVDDTRATFASAEPVIVSAGRAELSRGFDLLLRALRELLAQDAHMRLRLLLLPGREAARIRKLTRQLGISDKVEIREEVTKDLRKELATATVAAFPFRYDFATSALPLTVMEAMSVGLPVIGTDTACMAQILKHGVNGLVVPKGDRVALRNAIRRSTTDVRVWQELSDGALQTIRRWSWQLSVDSVADTYHLASGNGKMTEFDSRGHFGSLATSYETSAFDESAGLKSLSEREIRIVVDALKGPEFRSVLDVGVGTGRMARVLDELGKAVTGVDVTPEMLAEASRSCPKVNVLQAKLGARLPFRDGSFDAVLCVRVLKYVDDWDTALSEIARVLRASGRAVLEIANRRSAARWGYPGLPVRLVSFRELERLLARHGFTLTEVWRGSRAPFPIYRSIRKELTARRLEEAERFFDRVGGQVALARSFFVVLDAN